MMTSLGLLLQSTAYLGQKKILKVFTKEHGFLSFFAPSTALSPFCLAEWVYRKTVKEMAPLKEASLLNPMLHLRTSYEMLKGAGSIANDLLTTQLPNKRSEALFHLTHFYLNNLALAPQILPLSFKLKLLLHEGLLPYAQEPPFTDEEWEQIQILALSRKLSEIQKVTGAPTAKIQLFFEKNIRNT